MPGSVPKLLFSSSEEQIPLFSQMGWKWCFCTHVKSFFRASHPVKLTLRWLSEHVPGCILLSPHPRKSFEIRTEPWVFRTSAMHTDWVYSVALETRTLAAGGSSDMRPPTMWNGGNSLLELKRVLRVHVCVLPQSREPVLCHLTLQFILPASQYLPQRLQVQRKHLVLTAAHPLCSLRQVC